MKTQLSSYLVEFAGTPRAGKDTLIARLSYEIRNKGLRLHVVNEGARSSSIDKSNPQELLYWTVGRAALDYAQAAVAAKSSKMTVFNRGLFDRLAWIHAYARADMLSKTQARNWEAFLLSVPADLGHAEVILLLTPAKIALERAHHIAAGDERRGRVVNDAFLTTLNDAYLHCVEKHGHRFKDINVIDERNRVISIDTKFDLVRDVVFNCETA